MQILLPKLLLALLPLCPEPASDGHAALHSPGVEFFVEMPDLAAAKKAYPNSPLMSLIHDPDLAKAIEELSGEPFDPDALLQKALESAGDQAQLRGVLTMLDNLSAVSLSVGGLGAAPLGLAADEVGMRPSPGTFKEMLGELDGVHARIVVDFSSPEFAAGAAGLLTSLGQQDGCEAVMEEGGGALTFADPEGVSMQYRHAGGRLALLVRTTGAKVAPYGSSMRLEPNLSADERYKTLAGALEPPSGAAIWSGYSAIDHDVINQLAARAGAEPLSDTGYAALSIVFPFGSLAWRTALDGSTFRSASAKVGPATGAVVDTSFLKALPTEAIGAWAFTMDGEGLLEMALTQVAEATGSTHEELLAMAEEHSGLRPDRDLIAHLGSTVFVYLEPVQALGPPKLRAYLELKDADAFSESLSKLCANLAGSPTDEVSVKVKEYRGVELMTFDFAEFAAMPMMRPSPTLGVVDGRLLVSLNSAHAKREIKRLTKQEGESEPHRLLSSPALSGDALVSVGYLDWPQLVEGVYGLVKTAAGLFGGMAGPEMPDLSKLPPIEVVTRHFGVGQSITTQEGPLRITRAESSFGPEVLLVPLAGAAIIIPATIEELDPDGGGSDIPPPVYREPEAVTETVQADTAEQETRANLRVLRTGLAVYRMEHSAAPAELRDLMKKTANFPDGFLGGSPDTSLLDGWGRMIRYDVEGGKLWSVGLDGVDQSGAGDDIML